METWVRVGVLVLLVAVATLAGSFGGGEVGRLVGAARGGVGDDLVFDALGAGAISSVVLAFGTSLIGAKRLGLSLWVGVGVSIVCLLGLLSLFVGPWRVI